MAVAATEDETIMMIVARPSEILILETIRKKLILHRRVRRERWESHNTIKKKTFWKILEKIISKIIFHLQKLYDLRVLGLTGLLES